jgi:Mrp family chromosome partitioning ATPase
VAGHVPIEDASRRITLPPHATGQLDFLPGGTHVPNPAELAGSDTVRALMTRLKAQYDTVVLDTPPLSLVTDAAVTGVIADGVIVVARMGRTHRESLRRAVDELRTVGAPVIGTVLTDVHHGEDRYGHRYGQYYEDGDGPSHR